MSTATQLDRAIPAPVFASCQRWRNGREHYRPARELFNPTRAHVEPITEKQAKDFVQQHHYSRSYPAARFRFGVYWKPAVSKEILAGVAVFAVSMNQKAIPAYFGGLEPNAGVELSRLVLLDDLAANAESWFIARCFQSLRESPAGLRGVLSYADPLPRFREDGSPWKRGHIGTVYQCTNGTYLGRSSKRKLLCARDGRVFSERSLSKIRNGERGEQYAVRQFMDMGAPSPLPHEDRARYIERALAEGGFRKIPHPGNHVYAWWLGERRASPLPTLNPALYPKQAN